jgi:hypothetical protein
MGANMTEPDVTADSDRRPTSTTGSLTTDDWIAAARYWLDVLDKDTSLTRAEILEVARDALTKAVECETSQ